MAQNALIRSQAPAGSVGRGKRRIFWFGIVVVTVVVAVIFSVALHTAETAETSFENSSRAEMEDITLNRLGEFDKWLESVHTETARFANSKIIIDFARDVDEYGGNVGAAIDPESSPDMGGMSNIALLQSYLNNFISFSKFGFGSMLNSRGEIYLTSDQAFQSLTPRQRETVAKVVADGRMIFGPIQAPSERPMQMEFYVPVIGGVDGDKSKIVAVIYLTQDIAPKLRELLNLDGYASQGYSLSLLQLDGGNFQQADFTSGRLREVRAMDVRPDGSIAFGERLSVSGSRKVYSQGLKSVSMDAWVMLELDYDKARTGLDIRISDYYKLSALGALVLVLLVSVIWRWFISLERSQTLARFQELFSLLQEQKLLLDSINSAIAEPISLTDSAGCHLYVNHAFAEAFGRDAESIIGMDTAAVCGFDTARRLDRSNQHVLMTGEKVTTSEVIWLQSKRHCFQISKAPLREPETQSITGIVSVFRDVTKLMEAEERSHRLVQQTIDALVSTIEQADPFLGGHSRIMGEVAKLISNGLKLSDKETATITTAATLSQIGKMFVPREVLTKPGALTMEEKKLMEQHVQYTLKALSKIEFDLPVLEGIAQMNERLDGKGYPAGLKGDDISIYGKILAIANAFTAMARPRSYRPAMDVRTVLDTLEKQAGTSYDAHILAVLRSVLQTPAGEQVVASAARSVSV